MKKIKKALSVSLLMLGLVSVGAGAGSIAKGANVDLITARAELYPDWTCTVNKLGATDESTSSVIYGEVLEGDTVDELDEESLFTLHEDSGIGFALNGEAFTPAKVVVPAENVVYIDLGFEAQAGDVVTINGSYSNEDWEMTITFNNCALEFDGSAWAAKGETPDVPDEPDDGYTRYDLGALTFHVNSKPFGGAGKANNQLYLARLDGEALPFMSWDYLFTADTDGYFLINGEAKTPSEIKSTDAGFFWLFDALEAGDVVTIGGTFKCESQGIIYNIVESKFTWNGTNWEEYTPPVQYTTYTFNKLAGANGCTADVIYAYPTDGDALPGGDWDNRYTLESGEGLKLNDEVLSGWEIKQPGDFYIVLNATANVGDIFTIDGTFVNEITAKKFVFNNCKLQFNGTSWVEYVPPIEYTTYTMNKLGGANGCTADVIYAYPLDGDTLPSGDWDNRYTLESGEGLKLNGETLSGWEIKQPGDFYIVLGKTAVADDEFTIDGTFINETTAKKFVFNNCTMVFDGTTWNAKEEEVPPVTPDEPEITYTEYTLGAVEKIVDANAVSAYFVFGSGVSLPVSSWDYAFDYVSGNGITVDGVMINMVNSVKSVGGKLYASFGLEATKGSILKIGGVFSNDAQAVKYIIEDSEFKWNGLEWVNPSEPDLPDEPIVVEIGKLEFHVNTRVGAACDDNTALYLQRADGEALPVTSWDVSFVYESGEGFQVNGETVTPSDIKSTGDGFYWKFDALQAGDVVSISGTFTCEVRAMTYVIEESKFVWNGAGWEYYVEYTTHNVGGVVFSSGDATNVYLDRADGELFEIVSTENDINWTAAFAIRSGSGVGILLNGEQISMVNSVKFPSNMYIDLGATAQVGDVLEIGGTFYNVELGVEYVIAESELVFDGTVWMDRLTHLKESAKTELDEYLATFSQDNYYEAQWNELHAIVESAKTSIDAVGVETDLVVVIAQAKEDMEAVLLKAAVDELLGEVRVNAKAELATYKDKANYKDAGWAEIEGIIANANATIDASYTEEAIAAAVEAAKAAMDKVLTAAEADAAQLKTWRDEAKAEIQAYYSALNFELYSAEANATFGGYVATALSAIETAETKEAIDAAVAQFKTNVDSVEKLPNVQPDDSSTSNDNSSADSSVSNKGCNSVVGSGFAVSGIGLAAAAIVALRKKEDNE